MHSGTWTCGRDGFLISADRRGRHHPSRSFFRAPPRGADHRCLRPPAGAYRSDPLRGDATMADDAGAPGGPTCRCCGPASRSPQAGPRLPPGRFGGDRRGTRYPHAAGDHATGVRAKAHKHENHETAIHILAGTAGMWFGETLSEHMTMGRATSSTSRPTCLICPTTPATARPASPSSPGPTRTSRKASSCCPNWRPTFRRRDGIACRYQSRQYQSLFIVLACLCLYSIPMIALQCEAQPDGSGARTACPMRRGQTFGSSRAIADENTVLR